MQEKEESKELVTPGEVLGKASELKAGRGAYVAPHNTTVYASLTGRRSFNPPPPDSPDKVNTLVSIHIYICIYVYLFIDRFIPHSEKFHYLFYCFKFRVLGLSENG